MAGSSTTSKKRYETPVFYLEDYELSQAVAVGCSKNSGFIALQGNAMTCRVAIDEDEVKGASVDDSFLFIIGEACEDKYFNKELITMYPVNKDDYEKDKNDIFEEYCYHIPKPDKILFGS